MVQIADETKAKTKPFSLVTLDIHIAVDRAARFHSTFAAPMMMQNAQPPLRSNDLFDGASKEKEANANE
jgi:hypothetical protein